MATNVSKEVKISNRCSKRTGVKEVKKEIIAC